MKLHKGQRLRNRFSQIIVEVLEVDDGAEVQILLQGGVGRRFWVQPQTLKRSYVEAEPDAITNGAVWSSNMISRDF